MLRRKYVILTMVFAWVSLSAFAQYDPLFSHYFDMEPAFNPAAIGKDAKLNIGVAYALDLAGFKHNPQTMYGAADMPFYFMRGYHGAGVQFLNDRIGAFTHQKLSLQYSPKIKLFKGTLGIGIQAGLLSESLDGSKIDLEDSNDPAFTSSETEGQGLDVSAGLYYMRGPWYVGASAQHLTAPTIELGETNELKIDPTFYFTGGYNIKLRNPLLTIKSSALVRTDLVAWRADITGRLVYTYDKKMMYAGLSYSPTNSVTMLIGGVVQGIMLGYSYEYYTSALNPGNGSHELHLGYQMDINLFKKGRNRHQSVRIL
ncbi:MAG: type IX secretion system membrane protein PorP/SprF [Prevotella sp.]|nr:type IX secretion system membrane protein PorP/SprF [Prevotella sp.]